MARRVFVAIPLLAGLAPLTGQALGLGEMELRSALNQPFAAEIPLAVDGSDELGGLEVRLAGPEVFARFGIDRPAFLGDLRFVVQPDGSRPAIRVSSTRPVSEPFVSLLLEATWPKGRLLREYTVLLDPPALGGGATPAVAPPAAASETPRAVQRPAPDAEPAPMAVPAAGQGEAAGASSYGPVRPNQTLYVIAQEVRPDPGVSVNQVMLALFRANPEAFAGNINRLRAGAILRIPAVADMAAVRGADAEVKAQMAEWRAALPAEGARLQLVPPGEASTASGAAADSGRVATLEAELRESRRLLDLRSRELESLQRRLGESPAATPPPVTEPALEPTAEPDAGETALERLPGESPAEAADDAAAMPPAVATERAKRPRPARPAPPDTGGGLLDTIVGTVFNLWFLGAAALVLLGALFLYRRRSAEDPVGGGSRYGADLRDGPLPVRTAGEPAARDDNFIVEEASRGQPARAAGGDLETPLERTISTESGVDLDQADVVAEADFHMAYGLYDQAADLLTRALKDKPERRDLRLKLLEVYFIWENKAAFLKEAQALRARLPRTDDPEWNKVLIMGKQLCPGEALFAGAAADAGLDINLGEPGDAPGVDISFDDGDSGPGVDVDLTASRQGIDAGDLLDFDLGDPADATQRSRTVADPPAGRTMETPTIEAPAMDVPTMETPTVESSAVSDLDFDIGSDAPTTETPTIEAEGAGTLETPTLESVAPAWAPGSTGIRKLPDSADQTEEINLEDLGLDLTGLDEAAGDLATGNAPGEFDLSDAVSDSSASLLGLDVDEQTDGDSTAEVAAVGVDFGSDADGTMDLPGITGAMGRRDSVDDTAEQPRADFGEGLSAESGELSSLDFDIGSGDAGDDADVEPTASLVGARGRGPEGPTMTEVGTKLDLARAYIDMGDPDGARSILNEVLEEGDPGQRQEARKLLDELTG